MLLTSEPLDEADGLFALRLDALSFPLGIEVEVLILSSLSGWA